MTITNIKKRLVKYIENVEDKKAKAMYALFENDIESSNNIFNIQLKEELDKRYDDYKNGNVTLISSDESKERIHNLLAKKTK